MSMGDPDQSGNENNKEFHPDLKCRVCGQKLYLTDHGNHQTIYHCSSPDARYWDFERGSKEQATAWNHWEESETLVTGPRASPVI
jgi:hypothetical protein